MSFYQATASFDFRNKILVIPVISTANLSQLAADLLIASLALERIGVFDPKNLVPVVGAREYGGKGVTVPLELYGKDNLNVCVLQQRSPTLKSRKQESVDELLAFIKEQSFASVIFLAGVDSTDRTDSQMHTPIYYYRPPQLATSSDPLASLGGLQIPEYSAPSNRPRDGASVPPIPGGGLTRRILTSAGTDWGVPAVALLQFVIEGDNREDARLMATVVARVLGLVERLPPDGWKEPPSWSQGLFGTGYDSTLYS